MKLKLRALIPAHKQRGQSLVELAISLTVMLLLLAGAVTFGMAFFSYVAIRDAAQEGALFGSFNPYLDGNTNGVLDAAEQGNVNGDKICLRVKNSSTTPVNMSGFNCSTSTNGLSQGGNNIDVWATTGNACEGVQSSSGKPDGVQVRVEYDFPVFMPFVGAIVGPQIHLNAVVTDTILEPKCVTPP